MMNLAKRSLVLALSGIMSLSLLAGCGSSKQDTSSAAPDGTQTSESDSAASAEPVTIKIISVTQTEQPEGPAELALAEEYMKQNPNVKIEFIGVPMNDLYSKLTALATAGDMPDAFAMTAEFKSKADELGICEDLNNLFTAEELGEFYDNSIEDASVEGILLSLPWFDTPPALVYRADWFEEKGLTPPENWEDFIETAQKLTEDTDGDGKTDRWGFAMMAMRNGSAASRFFYMMRTFGIQELRQKDDGTWESDIGSDTFKTYLQMFTDFNNKYKVVPPGVIETGYPEAAQNFASGKVGMMITGPNAIGTIYAQNPDLKGKLASCPIPKQVQHVTTLAQMGYSVSVDSPNKEAVADYLRFLTSDENMLAWNELSGRTPVKKSLGDSEQLQTPAMKGFVDALQYCYSLPEHPGFSEVQNIVGEAYQNTIANGMSIDEASENAAKQVQEVINKYA